MNMCQKFYYNIATFVGVMLKNAWLPFLETRSRGPVLKLTVLHCSVAKAMVLLKCLTPQNKYKIHQVYSPSSIMHLDRVAERTWRPFWRPSWNSHFTVIFFKLKMISTDSLTPKT